MMEIIEPDEVVSPCGVGEGGMEGCGDKEMFENDVHLNNIP
jgi:hypothetical protein